MISLVISKLTTGYLIQFVSIPLRVDQNRAEIDFEYNSNTFVLEIFPLCTIKLFMLWLFIFIILRMTIYVHILFLKYIVSDRREKI